MSNPLVAVLDENHCLVGTKRKKKPGDADVVLPDGCDLPTDGSYVWRHGAFWPLGTGFERVAVRPPVSDDYALFDVIRSLGDKAPPRAREWADWYDAYIRTREEEKQAGTLKKVRR